MISSLKISTFIFVLVPFLSIAQTDVMSKIDSFQNIEEMGYICEGKFSIGKLGCGDTVFWNVVQLKTEAVEPLIDRLADTTKSKAFVPNFGGYWTIGDIAYTALQEIIHEIPTFDLLPLEFDTSGCGYCSYWKHVRSSQQNRQNFQEAVRSWYNQNQTNLRWVQADSFSSCDCRGEHPNNGYFQLVE